MNLKGTTALSVPEKHDSITRDTKQALLWAVLCSWAVFWMQHYTAQKKKKHLWSRASCCLNCITSSCCTYIWILLYITLLNNRCTCCGFGKWLINVGICLVDYLWNNTSHGLEGTVRVSDQQGAVWLMHLNGLRETWAPSLRVTLSHHSHTRTRNRKSRINIRKYAQACLSVILLLPSIHYISVIKPKFLLVFH